MQVTLREVAAPRSEASESPLRATPTAPSSSPTFAAVLRRIGADLDRGQSMLHSAMRSSGAGAALGDQALLALQVGAYRYSEMLDVASRLVDRATSAVKAVLQANGQ